MVLNKKVLTKSKKCGLKIVSWNVNGLRAVLKKNCFYSFQERYNDADIICQQEVKMQFPNDVDSTFINIPGYESFWCSHKTRRGYSGVVTYARCGYVLHLSIKYTIVLQYQLYIV